MARRAKNEGSVFKRKDGRWCAKVKTSPDGAPVAYTHAYARSHKEALAIRDGMKAELKATGVVLRSREDTLETYLSSWLDRILAENPKRSTWRFYERFVRLYIVPNIGSVKVSRVTPVVYRNLIAALAANGATPHTKQGVHKTLSAALGAAVSLELIQHNPLRSQRRPHYKPAERKVWEADEMRTFLAANGEPWMANGFTVEMDTALREAELLALRLSDVDFTKGELTVRQTLIEAGPYFEVGTPKSHERRTLRLSGVALAALGAQRRLLMARGLLKNGKDSLLFPSPTGAPCRNGYFLKVHFYPAITRAGVSRITFHDVRHSVGTRWLSEGIAITEVSRRLGHADVTTTLRHYAHATTKGTNAIVASNDAFFSTVSAKVSNEVSDSVLGPAQFMS